MNITEIERNGGGRTDPTKINNKTEREFFILFSRLLKEKIPGATIVHEPTLFEVQQEEVTVGTLPDFLITKPDGRKIYIDITRSRHRKKEGEKESHLKNKQKTVMKVSAPDAKFVVLSGENLESIQKKHPEVNFFP